MSLLALGLAIAYANSTGISRDVSASITISDVVPTEVLVDIDGNGKVDQQDLKLIARKLNTHPPGVIREDVNRDGIVDVFDLAIVAWHFGQEVRV